MVHGLRIGSQSRETYHSSCVDLGLLSGTWVQHCPGEATGTGGFVFRSQGSASPVFRVRLAGPTIEVLDVVQRGAGAQQADYRICKAGAYHVEIILLFANFSDPDDKVLIEKNHPCIEVAEGAFKYTLETELERKSDDLGSDCLKQEQSGIWVEEPGAVEGHQENKKQSFSVNRTIVAPPRELHTEQTHGHLKFRTQADTCVGQRTNKVGRTEKHLCLLGDSQTRYLAAGFQDFPDVLVDYCAVTSEREFMGNLECWRPGPERAADVIQEEPFSDDPESFNVHRLSAALTTGLSHCTDVVVNFGQWQLGWPLVTVEGKLYSTFKYGREIVTVLKTTLAVAQETGARVYWGTMNPHGFAGENLKCPADGYRWPHMIERYNKAAKNTISREFGEKVGIIDNFRISAHLSDLAFDGAHYKAPVGRALVENVRRCLDV